MPAATRATETTRDVAFYFDYVSPYTWLALMQAEAFAAAHRVRFVPRPVVYAALLGHHGLIGPAEVPAKRRYTFHDVLRAAGQLGLRFTGPPAHPFRSLEALRATCLFLEDPAVWALARGLADAAWGGGRALTEPAVRAEVVAAAGLDADDLEGRLAAPATKLRLRELTEAAIGAGVFGVPTFVHEGELFWGHDRLSALAARLGGALPPDRGPAERMLGRPSGVERRRPEP